jgi:hypothetical protein
LAKRAKEIHTSKRKRINLVFKAMKKIQKALKNYDTLRVEIYHSHFILYDLEENNEIETFDSEKDLLDYIKNQLKK